MFEKLPSKQIKVFFLLFAIFNFSSGIFPRNESFLLWKPEFSYKNISVGSRGKGVFWSKKEIGLIEVLCKQLPEEYFSLGEVHIGKLKKKKSDKQLSIDNKTRSIYISSDPLSEKEFSVLVLRGLTYLLNKKYNYSEKWEWRKISRWTGWDILGNLSENINPKGFVSKEAKKNPEEDFVYSVVHFFHPPDYKNNCEYLKNKIPLKYNFIRNIFRSRPDPQAEKSCPDTYKKWIDPDDIDHIELLIASPSYASIASIAGHLSMLIRRKNDIGGLSTVVSFVAQNTDKKGNLEHGWKYVSKGIFGKYKSILMEETLIELVTRQTITENRDIYRLKVNFSHKQIDKLIQRLWSFKTNFNYKYFFFNKNCTTMLLNLINFVLDKGEIIKDFDTIDLPLNIVFKVYKAFHADFIYPEFWSVSRNSKFSYSRNIKLRSEILKLFSKISDGKKISRLKLLFKGVIDPHNIKRGYYYSQIYNIFSDLVKRKNSPEEKKIIGEIGSSLLEYLINAKDFEKYAYRISLSLKSKAEKKPKPFFETSEIRLLMKYILSVRYIIKNKFQKNAQKIYDRIETERSIYASAERKISSYGSNYGVIFVTPELYKYNGNDYFSFSLNAATFSQKMGDKSVFSMGAGSEIELLSLNLSLSKRSEILFSGRTDKGWFFDSGYDILRYKKIFRKSDLKYSGTFNNGFGINLYSRRSNKMRRYNKTNYFSFSYILNVFERNNFSDFLCFEIGAGFSKYNYYDFGKHFYIDLITSVSLKFHLFKKYSNVFRSSISYVPKISLHEKSYNFKELNGKIEVDFNLNERKDVLFSSGIKFSKNIYKNPMFNNIKSRFKLSLFSTIRFHGKLVPSIGGFKKLMNKLF